MKNSQDNKPHSGAFLQSPEWGFFQEAVGARMKRVTVHGNEVTIFFIALPFGLHYAYVPRTEIDEKGLAELARAAKKEHAVFLRIEPESEEWRVDSRLRKVRDNQPSHTRIIDLSLSEEELLAEMKQKTRYNIRLAAKKGVAVAEATGELGVRKFLKLLEKTKERQEFTVHAPAYYETMLEVLAPQGERPDPKKCEARILVARFGGKVRAANIVLTYGDTAVYLHGASSEKDKEVMAPHLLQWLTMRWAKKEGFRFYDMWGVAPSPQPSPPKGEGDLLAHPLAGVTRFKEGFGGGLVTYPGTFEISLRPFWYTFIRLHRAFR